MYGKSNMQTYIIICKIDSQGEFAVWLRKLKQGLCINLEGWDGEEDGREIQKGGNICIPIAIHVEVRQKTTTFCKARKRKSNLNKQKSINTAFPNSTIMILITYSALSCFVNWYNVNVFIHILQYKSVINLILLIFKLYISK